MHHMYMNAWLHVRVRLADVHSRIDRLDSSEFVIFVKHQNTLEKS